MRCKKVRKDFLKTDARSRACSPAFALEKKETQCTRTNFFVRDDVVTEEGFYDEQR